MRATVVCPNYTCDGRELYTKCYLDTGMHNYRRCEKYKFYKKFQDRHNRKV